MTLDIAPLNGPPPSQRRSGITRVFKGSHSFTCQWRVYLWMEWTIYTCFCFPSRSWSSLTYPEGMEGWVGLGTTMASKQPARDRYVKEITVIRCSDRHASAGNWKRSRPRPSNSRPLGPKVATLTTTPPSRCGANWTDKSRQVLRKVTDLSL